MLSVCTVLYNHQEEVLSIFLESVLHKLRHVTEVIICDVSDDAEGQREWTEGGIRFLRLSHPVRSVTHNGHGIGLHHCISLATNDLLMLSDPDLFFYTAVDDIYLQLTEKYDLNIVGVSHPAAINRCYTFFPCVINCLVRKSRLPGPDWLKGQIKDRATISRKDLDRYPDDPGPVLDGQYLVVGAIPGLADKFPNHREDAIYDTGSNLWLWNEEVDGRWLAFQTTDCHTYNTGLCRGNFKVDKITRERLLFHAVGGTMLTGNGAAMLKEAYEKETK